LQDKNTGNSALTISQALIRPNQLADQTDCSFTPLPGQCSSQVAWVDYNKKTTGSGASLVSFPDAYPGYSITLGSGEKGVNAPLVVAGAVYFGTNLPKDPDPLKCTSNLGEARGYKLFPFSGLYGYTVFDSGGLPPSPVAGVVAVEVTTTKADGTTVTETKNLPFGIGLGSGQKQGDGTLLQDPDCIGANCTPTECTGADCKSAEGGQKPPISVSTSRKRTYWYQDGK